MAMNLPKGPPGARHHPGRQRTAREQSATILLPNSRKLGGTGRYDAVLWDQKTPNNRNFLGRRVTTELQNRGSIALETRQQIQAELSPPNPL